MKIYRLHEIEIWNGDVEVCLAADVAAVITRAKRGKEEWAMTQEQVHKIIDEWHEATEAEAGNTVGYSYSEWTELERLIAAAIVQAKREVWEAAAQLIERNSTRNTSTWENNYEVSPPDYLAKLCRNQATKERT